MKIRNPRAIKMLGWMGARLIQGWVGSVRVQHRFLQPNLDPHRKSQTGRYIYAVWHEHSLLLARNYARPDIHVLNSLHADGELMSEICRRLGFGCVRGSTNHGGTQALRELIRISRSSHIALTPDGPVGPRRRVGEGIIYLAAQTGLPIVPVGVAYSHAWRANSWDRFAVPVPFSAAYCIVGNPLIVQRAAKRDFLEPSRRLVEDGLHRVTDLAESWAATRHSERESRAEQQSRPVAA